MASIVSGRSRSNWLAIWIRQLRRYFIGDSPRGYGSLPIDPVVLPAGEL
jgi:hypothetical protein